MDNKVNKTERILKIYTALIEDDKVNKDKLANEFKVDVRTIQRDIDDIRSFLANDQNSDNVKYSRSDKKYHLENLNKTKFTNSESLAICKILLSSRAFKKEEMTNILEKFLENCVSKSDKPSIDYLIRNEKHYYNELKHKKSFMNMMWEIGEAIRKKSYVEIEYEKPNKKIVTRKLKPITIMFQEFYFYLTAFIEDKNLKENFTVKNDDFPTIYRIDKIKKVTLLPQQYIVNYSTKFDEKKYRDRIQFMYGGKLRKLEFTYTGPDVNYILDKLPTATLKKISNNEYLITAEVFGIGIDMWLKSQDAYIRNVKLI